MKINLKKIASFLIPLLPLLAMYQVKFIFNGLFELVCFFIFLLFLIMNFGKAKNDKTRGNIYVRRNAILLLILCVSSLLNIFNIFNYRNLLYKIIIFFILFGANRDCLDYKYFKKVYMFLAILCTIYLFAQLISFKVFSIYLPAKILPLETKDLFDAQSEMVRLGVFRIQSFFSEPSLYAQYILPIYFLILFDENKQIKNYSLLIIFTIGIFLSTSSLGIISIIIAWGFYLYKKSKKDFLKAVIVVLLLLPIGIYVINSNNYVKKSFESIFLNSSSSNKLTVRFYRGFSIYAKLPIEIKLLGSGIGSGEYVINKYEIATDYETAWHSEGTEYYNNIASSLIYGGILAGILFGLTQLSFIKSKSNSAQTLSLVYFIVSFVSSSFFNVYYLFYGINMIGMDSEKESKLGEVLT